MIDKTFLKHLIKFPISRTSRNYIRDYQSKIKLIMTLVVKDEEDIIEQNIRFHCALGCDGFIVSSHNSTDNTNKILEKLKEEGLVLEIIYRTSPNHQLNVWVNEMVQIAKKKYKADWCINADADEFYYSNSLDLKKSIIKDTAGWANVLIVDSNFLFPDDKKNYLTDSYYFVTKPFQQFEAEQLNLKDEYYKIFIGSQGCTKVIHSTKGNPRCQKGNHSIKMDKLKMISSTDIRLFHYHIKNYEKYVAKVIKWKESVKYKPAGEGEHLKKMIELYDNGKLFDDYNSLYGEDMRRFLIEQGVVSIDKSVSNFLKFKNITRKY